MNLTLSPSRLTFACSFFMLYCNVFVGCVWSITSKIRSETKPTISEQPDCASSFNSSCHCHFRRFLVESWPVWTKLRTRATSLSFPPRPFIVMLSSCDLTGELSLHAAIHTIFMFAEAHLALPFGWKCLNIFKNVISYYRGDTPFLKPWIHPRSVK